MGKHMILYRGSLKSCNYQCTYCPFSKHKMSEQELAKDRQQWNAFVQAYSQQAKSRELHAVMVVPYGEAFIHSWYWEGLAYLSKLPQTDAVGAQTNLSFPLDRSLSYFQEAGGVLEKLRLWATFHPEMTTVAEFVRRCRSLLKSGVLISVGAVGVPKNLELLRQLREQLPKETYVWINKMDGLGRPYTPAEQQAFAHIDPYFYRELLPVPADVSKCRGRLFVEGNGNIRLCNIASAMKVCWEDFAQQTHLLQCRQKRCSCYLAYGGRNEIMNQALFGPYPLFRIPRHPKAVFLDIEGTLFEPGCCDLTADVLAGLEVLFREGTALFFATTLPYIDAIRRCKKIRHLFMGGVFAGGAHLVMEKGDKKKESFQFLEESWLVLFASFRKDFHYRLLTYKSNGRCYKITLLRANHQTWKQKEAEELMDALPQVGKEQIRTIIENNCMQIVAKSANKASGVKQICQWMNISKEEVFAAGDSAEDWEMMIDHFHPM